MTPELPQEVRLLLFEVGDQLFGADASQVLRIGRPEEGALEWSALGPLRSGDRALVFATPDGEGQLRIDGVRGLRQVPVDDLRRVPAIARAGKNALGFWLDGDRPVLLVHLSETLKEGGQ